MNAFLENQNEFIRFLQIIYRRKWIVIGCIILALLPFIYLNNTSLPIYKATTQIVFEEKEPVISELGITHLSIKATFVQNLIEEIKSWSLINEVTNSLSDSVLNTFPIPDEIPSNYNFDFEIETSALLDFSKKQYLTYTIQKNVSAKSVPKSDVITISANAYDRKAAAIIANTTADILMKRNLNAKLGEVNQVKNTIDEQLKYYHQKVIQSELALRDFKEANKVTSLDQESQEIFRRITEAEIEYNRTATNLDASIKRLEFVRSKLSKQREELVVNITTITSPWAQELKNLLVDLQVQHTTLRVQDYDENHPKMKQLSSQIKEAEKSLREETLKIARGENTIDPLSQIEKDLEEIASLEVEIHTYKAQEIALNGILNSYNNSLRTLPQKELELGKLERDKAVADGNYTMLLQKREEAKIKGAEIISSIRIIDPARIPRGPIRPNKKLNLVIGFFLGSILGIGLSLFLEVLDVTIKTVEDVEKYTELPVLSMIPRIKNGRKEYLSPDIVSSQKGESSNIASELITFHDGQSPVSETFRTLRTNLQVTAISGSPLKTILVTSANPGEGKSFISANLAITMANLGLKTLLVDADLRKSVIHTFFNKRIKPGLVDILLILSNLEKAKAAKDKIRKKSKTAKPVKSKVRDNKSLISSYKKMVHSTDIQNLYLITSGEIPPNPSELLGSETMRQLNSRLKKDFDIIIYDLPPVIAVTDAAVIAREIDGIILVIQKGKSKPKEILRAKDLLEKAGNDHIVGSVLNKVHFGDNYYSYYYYKKKDRKDIVEKVKDSIGKVLRKV